MGNTFAQKQDNKRYNKLPAIPAAQEEATLSEPFFVLTDRSFGSNEHAQVRIEVPASYAQGNIAMEADIRVYRISNPLPFLEKQPDLHRVQVKGNFRGSSSMPVVEHLWDSWIKSSRLSWQRVFSAQTRSEVTKLHPELKIQPSTLLNATPPQQRVQFDLLTDYPLTTRMRYPLWQSKPIAPPKDAVLPGSSSNFISVKPGNVMVSVGKLPAGLYLIETMIANQRATALLFVSDTVLIAKTAKDQMLVWTANRQNGKSHAGANLLWTDGVGTLERATTDKNGIAIFKRTPPEHTYLIGEDVNGGVFVSENFYYDSEIYNTKLFAFTDRPLYRPGDEVNVKVFERTFINAQTSKTTDNLPISYKVYDPAGSLIFQGSLTGNTISGLSSKFTLPEKTMPGGYDLTFTQGEDNYSASFRVANYIKPHFDILLNTPTDLKTGKEINSTVSLRYPNGEPVQNAQVNVTVRAQRLSMVDGQLEYAGMFPVALTEENLTSNNKGEVSLKLPAAKEPSRYVVTILASDAAAYRVKMTREILIERGINPYTISTVQQFGKPGENVTFQYQAQGQGGDAPTQYELMRLEDGKTTSGSLQKSADNRFTTQFKQPGSYTVMLKDKSGNLLGATNYWVQGDGLIAAPDTVEIVFNKADYQIGETAQALVNFPVDVEDALLTLERDNVESYSLLSQTANWLKTQKISKRQYVVNIPVTKDHSPNMTFSVLYQQQGDYIFQNAGITVKQPQININVQADKAVYKPKEKVTINLDSLFEGKNIPANLALSVVDEMVYVLQPEVAPDMVDFFYHTRRNNVTTQSSLNFIGYDKSASALDNKDANGRSINERAIKVLERPRREDKDTAYWNPTIQTDENGKATVSFTLPDSLTRWRITVRAMDKNGNVGQKIAYIQSEQPYYLKWTGPTQLRTNDKMTTEVMAFNQTQNETRATWVAKNGETTLKEEEITLKPGPNYLSLPIAGLSGDIRIQLQQNGQTLDALATHIDLQPANWTSIQQQQLTLSNQKIPMVLPADASNIRVSILPKSQASFIQVLDGLIEYPYGCVEQTASRLIPLSIAYGLQPKDAPSQQSAALRNQLTNQRMRLMDMAGEEAKFTWWGSGSDTSLFISSYAYYADWQAAKALNMPLSKADTEALLKIYEQHAENEPLLQRTLSLWFMSEMNLPVKTLLNGTEDKLLKKLENKKLTTADLAQNDSLFFYGGENKTSLLTAVILSAQIHKRLGTPLPEKLAPWLTEANKTLQGSDNIAIQSLLYMSQKASVKTVKVQTEETATDETVAKEASAAEATKEKVPTKTPENTRQTAAINYDQILAKVSSDYPTIERSLALIWLKQAGINELKVAKAISAPSGWNKLPELYSGSSQWGWYGKTLPKALNFNNVPGDDLVALVRYQTETTSKNNLPVTITRTLYRLEPYHPPKNKDDDEDKSMVGQLGFKAVAIKPGESLQSNQLYIDEITLMPTGSSPALRYGLLEIGLPSGANVEASTWGMNIAGLDTPDSKPFGNSTFEEGVLSYRLPVDKLTEKSSFRQLVRFSQRGVYQVPPARLFKMYQPSQSTLQQADAAALTFTVK